ncbi:MAG TPA: hypothetical protein VFJ92_08120, partial [Gemmatimonadales bacterium]|nr:hypothetical protein [Gemmatimonadales bacterium]
ASWFNPAGLSLSEKSQLSASANAYEFTGFALEGVEFTRGGTRFSSIGSYFGGVLGAPIVKSQNLRLGFSFTKPVSWAPSRIEGAIESPESNESFLYSAYVSFSTFIPALNAGLRLTDRLRVGAGLGYAYTSLYQNQSLSDRLLTATGATTGFRTIETDGNVGNLLVTGSAQFDVGERVRLGAIVTAPGVRVAGSSRVTYQNSVFRGAESRDIAFRDDEMTFDYKPPLLAGVGAAARFGRAEVEVDVRYHGARDAYVLFSSEVPATLVTTDAAGTPTEGTLAFADIVEETKAVTNVSVGGHYGFSPSFRVHAGFFTDNSPVERPETSIFRAVDLTGFSTGVSFGAGKLTASAGVSGSTGTSAGREVGPTLGGREGVTKVKVRTINLLYAVSYAF